MKAVLLIVNVRNIAQAIIIFDISKFSWIF